MGKKSAKNGKSPKGQKTEGSSVLIRRGRKERRINRRWLPQWQAKGWYVV